MDFGTYIRGRREALRESSSAYSVRQVARRAAIEPSYLSKIERGDAAPPGEESICRLADVLGEDRDVLLAMAGKVSAELRGIILQRPELFAELLREMKAVPDHAVLRLVREVRDGSW